MASPSPRSSSFATTSRTPLRPSKVTIDDSCQTEADNTQEQEKQKRKLSQKQKTLSLCQSSIVGHLSPWPTYTSGQTILHNRKPCSDYCRKRAGSWRQQPLGITKPRYLEQLENYLRKELLLLDLSTDSAQELRLQPYREIFDFFIEDFKTYKPLLSSIKNAYEVMLAHQREKIRALEPLKAKLVTVNEECNERILAMRAEERSEISLLKKEKMNLLKLVDKKNEEKISLQSEVTKLRKNLAEEYLRYLSERDARKILIADLNELRYQREDMSLAQSPGVVAGGPDRWHMLAEGKNSDQLVDVLLEEIGEMLLQEKDFFPGLGYGESVPPFLRVDGVVENKKPTKKDVVNLLKDAWKERLAEEQKEKFSDFFFSFLERRFGPADAMAWAYTVFENIKLFHSNEIMSQFYAVLMEKMSESVYVKHKETISQLLKEMTNADSQNEGLLTMEQFSTVLRSIFPFKKEEKIQELMEAAGWQLSSNADWLSYQSLFTEDEEGQVTPFMRMLWEQYVEEKDEYLQELKQDLGLELYEKVTLPKVREALMTIDPSLDKQTLNSYLSQAFQLPLTELPEESEEKEEDIMIKLQTVLERLQMIDIRRRGPREQEPTS
ncbi:translin associated factor X interacting protein 1 [Phyllostomus discolor]|uniref:Translin associated factor X interacting protein 1 n=1 Tax=Phyllostomus discolor TaxID=89673 RepID=A0A834DE58_9CHIR|nr:translin associated factor X interacting protein 1 [Phyllostomus discolor]